MSDVNVNKVTNKAVKSIKWSALMEIVSKVASPLVLIILSQLLTPEDFGIVATATIAISFFQMFNNAGLNQALIHTQNNIDASANVVFWVNIGLGSIIYLILFFTAPYMADFFNSPDTAPVLRVLSLQVLIGSFATVQQGLFVKEFEFKKLFWVRLFTAFFPGFFSIPLAFYGYGVWALVYGSLAGQLLNVVLLWWHSKWRPTFSFDRTVAASLFSFGAWVIGETILNWFIGWGDSLLLGKFLGVEELGVYRVGVMIVTVVLGIFINPVVPILLPMFSKLQNNKDQMRTLYNKALKILTIFIMPLSIAFFFLGGPVVDFIFPDKWEGLGYVVSTMGFVLTLGWLVGMNPALYKGLNRPDYVTKTVFFSVIIYLPVYYFCSQYGLDFFVKCRLGLVFIGLWIQIYFLIKLLNSRFLDFVMILKNELSASIILFLIMLFANLFIGKLEIDLPIIILNLSVLMLLSTFGYFYLLKTLIPKTINKIVSLSTNFFN